jgi:hypothetical protein
VTRFAEHTIPQARRSDQAASALAVCAGLLLAWGAFSLLGSTEDKDLTMFWVRLAAGIALAGVTVWAAVTRKWLATCFLAFACCITPVAASWTWVPLLYVVLAVWALVKFLAEIMTGREA